LTIWYWGA